MCVCTDVEVCALDLKTKNKTNPAYLFIATESRKPKLTSKSLRNSELLTFWEIKADVKLALFANLEVYVMRLPPNKYIASLT